MPPDCTGTAVGIHKKQTIKPHHHETIHRNGHGRSLVGHAARRQEDRRRTGQFRLPHLAIRNRQPGRECRGKGHGGERAIGELTGQIAERTYRENGLPHRKRRGGSGRKGIPCYNIREDVAWDHIPFTPQTAELARQTQAVCFGSLAQRHPASRSTIHRFLDTMPDGDEQYKIFDINLRQGFYTQEIISTSLQSATFLKSTMKNSTS